MLCSKAINILFIIFSILSADSVFAGSQTFFFDADSENHSNLVLDKSTAVTNSNFFSPPRALRAVGKNQIAQYAVSIKGMPAAPNDKLRISFLFKADPEAVKYSIVECFFTDAKGKILKKDKARIAVSETSSLRAAGINWDRMQKIFTVPDDKRVTSASFCIRLVNVPTTSEVYIDNIRVGSVKGENDFFCDSFKTDFARLSWTGQTPFQERFIIRDTGKILYDWQKAKAGEACFAAYGNGSTKFLRQNPLVIRAIKVEPGNLYDFSFSYVNNEHTNRFNQIGCIFKDEDLKVIGGQGGFIKSSLNWNKFQLTVKPPTKTAFMDIYLKFYGASKKMEIRIDELEFKKSHPRVELNYEINPVKKILLGKVKTYSVTPQEIDSISVELSDSNSRILSVSPNETGEITIDLAKLPDTEYKLQSIMKLKNGEFLKSAIETFHNYNKRPWENSTLGKLTSNDLPPFPWRKLNYDRSAQRVITWDPQVEFSKTGALAQIELKSTGQKLLQKPVQLELNGKDIFTGYTSDFFKEEVVSPNHALFKGQLHNQDLKVKVNIQVSFDGMVKHTFDIQGTRDTSIDKLTLKYRPVADDYAICSDGTWTNYEINVLRDKKHYETRRFYPMVWTGMLEYGLYWCAEKLYPELQVQQDYCHTMNYGGDHSITLVNAPLALKAGQSYKVEYAFGSTPFRPATQDVPQWRFRSGKYSNGERMWPKPQFLRSYGFPQAPDDSKLLKQFLQENANKRNFIYMIPFFCMTNIPQYSYFSKSWKNRPARGYAAGYDGGYSYPFFQLDISNESWQNLFLKHLKKFLTDYKWGGLYLDCISIYPAVNDKGGFSFRVFAVRDFLQRIYILQRRLDRDSWTFAHCGASVCSFASLFSDIMLTGEHYREQCMKNRYYLEFMSLEEFRVHNCINFGPLRMFLPEFSGDKALAYDVAVHTMGLVMLHNLYLDPKHISRDVIDACLYRYYSFYDRGKNNRFIPYWAPDAINSGNQTVPCSTFVNDSGMLSIYLNTTNKPQEIGLPEKYRDGMTVYDPLANKTVIVKPGAKINIAPYMMKMVLYGRSDIWNAIH